MKKVHILTINHELSQFLAKFLKIFMQKKFADLKALTSSRARLSQEWAQCLMYIRAPILNHPKKLNILD